jgi:hypothetical protein
MRAPLSAAVSSSSAVGCRGKSVRKSGGIQPPGVVPDYAAIPAVTFSDREVARVGLTEIEARETLGSEPLVLVLHHDYSEYTRMEPNLPERKQWARLTARR